jgi:hypothetical protein
MADQEEQADHLTDFQKAKKLVQMSALGYGKPSELMAAML